MRQGLGAWAPSRLPPPSPVLCLRHPEWWPGSDGQGEAHVPLLPATSCGVLSPGCLGVKHTGYMVNLGGAWQQHSLPQVGSVSAHSAGESVVEVSLSPTHDPGTKCDPVWRLQFFDGCTPPCVGAGDPGKGRLHLSIQPGHATSGWRILPTARWIQKCMAWAPVHPGRSALTLWVSSCQRECSIQ